MKISAFFVILLFSVCGYSLNIDDAVKAAMEKNYLLKANSDEVKKEMYNVKVSESQKMPSLIIEGNITKLDDSKKLNMSFGGGSQKITQVENFYKELNIGVNYNLYTGGAVTAVNEMSKKRYAAYQSEFEESKNNLIFQVKYSYLDILKLHALKSVALKHIESLKSHYEDVLKFYNQGIIAKIDILQTKVKLTDAEQDLVTIENNIKIAKGALAVLMGELPDLEFNTDDIKSDFTNLDIKIDELYKQAESNRGLVRAFKERASLAADDIELSKSEIRPKVYLYGGYRYSDSNDALEPKGGFMLQSGVRFALDWDKGFHKVSASKSSVYAVENQLKDIILKIKLDVKKAVEEYNTAKSKLNSSKVTVSEAEEYFRIVKLKYDNSIASNSDVLDAEAMLINAMNGEKNSFYDVIKAYYGIEKSIGTNVR